MKKAFECKQCGSCCYGEGGILLQEDEIPGIACFLGVSVEDFLKAYCEVRNRRRYISTGADGYCVFFHRERQCLIHPVKPRPCCLWPFYPALVRDGENWEMAKGACPGINPDCSFEEFRFFGQTSLRVKENKIRNPKH